MKYVFYNIRGLIKNEKFIFAVMLLCIFISAWILNFSYGLYQNYFSMRVEADEESKYMSTELVEGETLTYAEIKLYLESLSQKLLDEMGQIQCSYDYEFELTNTQTSGSGRENRQVIQSSFVIRNGEYRKSTYLEDVWKENNMIVTGHFFSDIDNATGSNTIMISNECMKKDERKLLENLIIDDNTVSINGINYNIIGSVKTSGFYFFVPFLSVPEETPAERFAFYFPDSVKRKSYDELVERANEIIPGKLIFSEFTGSDEESIYIYSNIMMISVLIAALVIVNFAFLYRFIFGKRRRQLAIMRICGCTAARAWAICLGECIVICVPVFLAGMLTYIPFMHNVLSGVFEYMETSYNTWIYAAIFGIYLAALIIVMGIFLAGQVGKTLAESRKEKTV